MNSQLPPAPESYRRKHKLLGPVMNRLHLSCHHFSELSVVSMDRPLSFGEKMRRLIHYCACGLCRKVEKQMKSLPSLVRAHFSQMDKTRPDPEFLEHLRLQLTQAAKHTDSRE